MKGVVYKLTSVCTVLAPCIVTEIWQFGITNVLTNYCGPVPVHALPYSILSNLREANTIIVHTMLRHRLPFGCLVIIWLM